MKRRMLTKVLSMFLALTLVLGMVPADAVLAAETTVMSEENGGGTPREAAAAVTTVDELKAVADGNYILEADLELPADWTPIAELSGTFDGNGYTITLNGTRLFNTIAAGGTVKNLSLDGITADNVDISPLVKTNNGTVRNCVSYVAVSATESMGKASGLVHVNNGTISNCLFHGTLTTKSDKPRYRYGIAGNNGGTISSSYYVDADDRYQGVCGGTAPSYEAKVTAEAIVTEEFLAKMNDGPADGDLAWGLADGKPVPGGADSGSENDVDKSALAAAIADAESFDLTTELYSDASLQAFKNAIAAANAVYNDAGAVQDQIDEACAALTEAQDGLTVLSLEPVDFTDKEVTEIDSPLALASMEEDGFYRLTADIDLSQTGAWWSVDAEMPAGAVLDGNGHTITLDGSFSGLFKKIGTDAVVQNLGIKGSMMSWGSSSAIANGCYGRIINCWSLAQVTTTSDANVGGLVATLYSGGGISNCYSAGLVNGTPEGNKGGIAGESRENTVVQNSYWLDKAAADAVGSAEGRVLGCAPKNRREFYSEEFTALLNANRGTNGLEWGVCAATGYPWFGEAGTYIPPEEVKHTVTFTEHDGAVQDFYNTDGLTISRLNTTGWAGFAGTFSVKDSETPVYFAVPDYKNDGKDAVYIGADNDVYAENTGTATVVAYSSYSYGNYSGKLFQFEVTVTDNTDIAGIRFVYGNKTIENNQTLTVAGSEVVKLTPQVQLQGSTEWKTVPNAYFTFTGSEGNYCENTGKCWAKVPGESTITAVGMNQTIAIKLVSVYVPITAIKPIPEGTYKLHERNPNSSGNFVDLKLAADQFDSVVATPYNASYAHDWTLTSDHPDVAEYYEEWIAAVLPKKPGTAVLTAKANDPEHPVSGQTTITLEYLNPVTAVTMTEDHITVKENEKLYLPMTFTGPKSAEGYHVSEAGMTWKYESTDGGSVKISRDTDVVELQQTKEYCISNDSYFIKGITAGTVKVTGTPADTTGNAQPVTFTVTVEGNGTVTPPERPDKTEKIQTILDTVSTQFKGTGLDWNVVDMSAYGMADQMNFEVLREGAEAVLDKTGAPSTDFERVAIALTAAGIDASSFERADGTKANFIEKIYTMEKLGTVNGYIFALNAYDSGNYPLPKDALWTRDKVIDYLLSVQTEDGGWNLSGKTTAAADVDMTAMAVTALSLYQDRADVAEATAKALEYLSEVQTDNGGFKSGGQENSNSAAMVILALTSLNIDPDKDARFVKGNCSAVDGLLGFETADHTFGFTNNEKSNAMATEQGFRALTAYKNWQKEKDAYYIYDFSANVTPEEPTEPEGPTDPEKPTDPAEGGTVTFTVERFTIGQGFYQKPVQLKFEAGQTAMDVLVQYLGDKGVYNADKTYLGGIKGADLGVQGVSVPAYIKELLGGPDTAEAVAYGNKNDDVLSEFDYAAGSGWMYSVNGKFPNVGMADYELKDGDVFRLQFTLMWGMDLSDKSFDGSEGAPVSEKEEAMKLLAEFTGMENFEELMKNEAVKTTFHDLYKKVQNAIEPQESIDAAVKALQDAIKNVPTDPSEPTDPEKPSVDKTALSKAIKEAEGLNRLDYTAESFRTVADALAEAKEVEAKADATQKEVDAAEAKLTEAVKALKKPDPKPPVTDGDKDKDKDKEVTLTYKNYPISVTGKNLDQYELVLKALTANDADVKKMQQVTPSNCSLIRLYDVKLLKNGEEVQPESAVKVNFNVGSKYNGKTLTVLHIVDGKVEKLKGKVEDGILTVSVDTLGKFGVTVTTASAGNNTADDTDTSAKGNGSGSSGNGNGSSGSGSVKTGDETPLMFYTFLLCAAVLLWILGKPIIGKLERVKEK